MKGNIFNIQKFSIHDGPGIRTTVFFKGCPLRCKWCSNPESQQFEQQISYDMRKCIGCRACMQHCPQQCISWDAGKAADLPASLPASLEASSSNASSGGIRIDTGRCISCFTCVNSCPAGALKTEGEMKDLQEVVKICLQDLDFYQESGGGVTLSGGECMCQSKFCQALIRELHQAQIHVTAETTGHVDSRVFRTLAPMFDLLLFDVKHCDPGRHLAGTGVTNELILKNLHWAADHHCNILPRIPVIPGFNDTLDDAKGIAALLQNIGLSKAQLLPFHQFGERKYELLGREYSLRSVKALRPEDLEPYRQIFLRQGIDCTF